MPRDVNGNYSLPAGNPVISGTIIESVWANSTMDDIAVALTDSLSRTGLGSMLGSFKFSDGSMAAPGISWTNEPSSGWWRSALNTFWYSVGNENIFGIDKDGITLASGKQARNFNVGVVVQDADPAPVSKGVQWFESDSGALYMRYQNPDLTYTYVRVNGAGGYVAYPAPRVVSAASSATPTVNANITDIYKLTALAAAAAFQAPTGSPVDGQKLIIVITDNGTPRALTYNAVFRAIGATLPATTTANKTIYIFLIYNALAVKWDAYDVKEEA